MSNNELCGLVSILAPRELHLLVTTPPLGNDVLEHAMTCNACSYALQAAMEDNFKSLPKEEQEMHLESAQRILDSLRAAGFKIDN